MTSADIEILLSDVPNIQFVIGTEGNTEGYIFNLSNLKMLLGQVYNDGYQEGAKNGNE